MKALEKLLSVLDDTVLVCALEVVLVGDGSTVTGSGVDFGLGPSSRPASFTDEVFLSRRIGCECVPRLQLALGGGGDKMLTLAFVVLVLAVLPSFEVERSSV